MLLHGILANALAMPLIKVLAETLSDHSNMPQVSERVVLAQKAYILFYIKNPPTNGHAAPAEPLSPRTAHHQAAQPPAAAQKPQQAPQPDGLNKLQPAPLKSQVNGKTSKASSVVYGPAERPKTGLTAALQLRDELLAPPVDASVQQQSGRQTNAAFAHGTTAQTSEQGTAQHQGIAAQRPASQSSLQQASATGIPSAAGHVPSQQAAGYQAEEDKRQVKQLAKRKAAELGSIKRPGMLQRMNPSGLEAAPDAADMPKRKKQATDKAAAASKHSLEESVRSAASVDAPGSASESSLQQVGSAAFRSHDHAEDCVPSISGRSDHAQPAPAADKAARYAAYKQPLQQ